MINVINKLFGTKEKDSKEKRNTEFLSFLEKFVLPESMKDICTAAYQNNSLH